MLRLYYNVDDFFNIKNNIKKKKNYYSLESGKF